MIRGAATEPYINMAKEIMTLKKREKLISPDKIICGGEFNNMV